MALDSKAIIERIDAVYKEYYDWKFGSPKGTTDYHIFTLLRSTIEQIAPRNTTYQNHFKTTVQHAVFDNTFERSVSHDRIDDLGSILLSIRFEYEHGYIGKVENIAYAHVFNDYLEMAEHFLSQSDINGYIDTAAIVICCSLEQHIKRLCIKNNITLTRMTKDGKELYEETSTLNNSLYKKGVYDLRYLEYIKAWIKIRNDVTHGNWGRYAKADIDNMLEGVRLFTRQYP